MGGWQPLRTLAVYTAISRIPELDRTLLSADRGGDQRGLRASAAPVHLERLRPGVNPWVEIGVNPDSHPWADAPDGPGAAR